MFRDDGLPVNSMNPLDSMEFYRNDGQETELDKYER